MKSLESLDYRLIKAHFLDRDNSPLSQKHQILLDRIFSAAKLLDKYPVKKNAVALHRFKFPEISRSQAYEDLKFAERAFPSVHTFDYDFWQTWIKNSIVQNIERLKKYNTAECRKIIVMEHANLIKVIGLKPPDTKRNEECQFYFPVNFGKRKCDVDIDLEEISKRPGNTLRELSKALKDLAKKG